MASQMDTRNYNKIEGFFFFLQLNSYKKTETHSNDSKVMQGKNIYSIFIYILFLILPPRKALCIQSNSSFYSNALHYYASYVIL